jgi:hypothetical protein
VEKAARSTEFLLNMARFLTRGSVSVTVATPGHQVSTEKINYGDLVEEGAYASSVCHLFDTSGRPKEGAS